MSRGEGVGENSVSYRPAPDCAQVARLRGRMVRNSPAEPLHVKPSAYRTDLPFV